MVIGKGLVGKAFEEYKNDDEFLIFASGVSNSKLSTDNDFLREHELLTESIKNNRSKKLVYFSTCSIEDPDLKNTPYSKHKLAMEELIKTNAEKYFIFRLSNLAGHTDNQHTILNFFYQHIKNDLPFQVWGNSERNIIDVEDVYAVTNHILQNNLFSNQVINIANPKNYASTYIVKSIENFCGKKSAFTKVQKGAKFSIDISFIKPIFKLLNIEFTEDYLLQLLKKYYS